ncbi:urease accessory protein D [Biomphalaria glabrata]|nr:urease accessory protein D [Biomphalaria glabrata]
MFRERNPTTGEGYIEVQAVQSGNEAEGKNRELTFNKANVVSRRHTYPFHFHVPEYANSGHCKWIYSMSYGGGLVGGDTISATVKVGPGCAALVSTQESTKVYHCNYSGETTQTTSYYIGDGSLLCVLPDATVCYKDANFNQTQVVQMRPSSNLVLLDWMLSGRLALDEFWAFKRYKNSIEVYVSDELIIKDCTDLADTPQLTVSQGMRHFHVYGTLFVLGAGLQFLAEHLLGIYARKKNYNDAHDQDLIVSISPTQYTVNGDLISGCYLRFLASDMKNAAKVIQEITSPLIEILGGDPFERKL